MFDTYNDRVQKFAPDHSFLLEWGSRGSGNGQFIDVQGTVDAANGLIYTADTNNRIQVFDLDGNYLDKWGNTGAGPGQFRVPLDVAVDTSDNVYVGEDQPGRVQKFDASGRFLDMTGSGGTLPGEVGIVVALTTDDEDNLYIADWTNSDIKIVDRYGELIGVIDEIPGLGTIEKPCGIAADGDGAVYVTSCSGNALYKLLLLPLT